MWNYTLLGIHLIRKFKLIEKVGVVHSYPAAKSQSIHEVILNVNVIIETYKCVTLKIKS